MVTFNSLFKRGIGTWLAAVVMTGCGGGSLNIDVRKSPGQRPDIDANMASSGTISIPASEPFNLTAFRSGQEGDGRGQAKALEKNGATCTAEAGEGSSAWGEFQLGYCFDNATGTPLQSSVKLHIKLSDSNSLRGKPPNTGIAGQAVSTLQFMIKDVNGTIIKNENLLAGSADKGFSTASQSLDLVYDVTFLPELGYYIVLAGRTDASAGPSQSVNASLTAEEFSMQIQWKAAPAGAAAQAPPAAPKPTAAATP